MSYRDDDGRRDYGRRHYVRRDYGRIDDGRRDDRDKSDDRARDHHIDEIQEKRMSIEGINREIHNKLNLQYNPSQMSTNSKSPEYYNKTLQHLSKSEFISKKTELDTFINEKFAENADKKDKGGFVLIDGENLFYKLGSDKGNFSIIEKILRDESNRGIHETLEGFTNCIIFIQNHRDREVVNEISRIFRSYFTNIKIIETQSKTEIDDIFLIYSLVEILKKNTPCIILSSDNFTWFRYNREILNSSNIHMMVARGPQTGIFRNSFKLDVTEFLPDEIAYGPPKRGRVSQFNYARGKLTLRAKRKRRKNTQSQKAKPKRRTNTQTQRAKPKIRTNRQSQRAKSKKDKKNKN